MPTQTPATPDKGSTVILPKGEGGSPKAKQIGETIILPKRSLQNIGEAGTIASPEKPKEGKGGTIVLQKRDCQEKDKLPFVDSKESPKASQEGPDLAKSPQDDGKGTDIEIKSSGTTVIDDNDDSDIEELTAVYEATLNDEEKPRARAAWGAHGMLSVNFVLDLQFLAYLIINPPCSDRVKKFTCLAGCGIKSMRTILKAEMLIYQSKANLNV